MGYVAVMMHIHLQHINYEFWQILIGVPLRRIKKHEQPLSLRQKALQSVIIVKRWVGFQPNVHMLGSFVGF